MKKIMILGAGVYQAPFIKRAKEMGLYTIVVGPDGHYPGLGMGDKTLCFDTTDAESILCAAREERIDAIVTGGTDVAVPALGLVCDALGLCGLSAEAAKIASNKLLMKTRYEAYGVRTARFRRVGLDAGELETVVRELAFPLIFKAVDSSGSRGIVKVTSRVQFAAAREAVRRVTRQNYFIVEEFIEGEEFGAEAFVCRGELQFILPNGKYVHKGEAGVGVPVGHYAPLDLPETVIEDAAEQIRLAAAAMRLDNCAINADLILSGGKTYVLELGGRSGATCLAELVSLYYGYDYYEKIIRVALGEEVSFASTLAVPNASRLLVSDRSGVIRGIQNNNDADDRIVEVQFDYLPGESVRAFRVGPDRIGHVVTKGDTLAEAVAALDRALSNIEIDVQQAESPRPAAQHL